MTRRWHAEARFDLADISLTRPAAATDRPVPAGGRVLLWALIGWGLGHVLLGYRRAWLLLLVEPLALLAVGLLAVQLIDGTHWLVVFVPYTAVLLFWIGQAIDAYRRAIRMGGAPGGEMVIMLFLPLVVTALTAFWLLGGRHGSPSATLQDYIADWSAGKAAAAAALFAEPPSAASVEAGWATERAQLAAQIETALARYGDDSGLDPDHPLNNLRVREASDSAADDGRVAMIVEIVRSQRVETTILGVIPTAGQETVVVAPEMTIWLELHREQAPDWLPLIRLDSYAWRISAIEHPGLP